MSIRRLILRGRALESQRSSASSPKRPARLLWAAEPVLLLVTRLRAATSVPDLLKLRERLVEVLLDFRSRAEDQGSEPSRVTQATEVLAALIDHVVNSMPWGADAGWRPLARISGGRGPAQRLLDIARATSSDADTNELLSAAVLLGFDNSNRAQDDPYVDQLLALVAVPGQKQGLHLDQGLSPEGHSPVERTPATSWLPLWVSSLVVASLLAALYFALQVSLGVQSDRVYAHMAGINAPRATVQAQPASSPRLARPLFEQISARSLVVHDEIDRSVVVIPGSKLFEAGGTTVKPSGLDMLRPLASALQATPGRVQVIGHSDGAVARSARFPSDWEFSVERARAVAEALGKLGVPSSRLTYDGRANIEPLPVTERATIPGGDGRIEIVLLVGRR